MNNDYKYEYEWDFEYCYPDSNVLKNKLNITDPEKLNNAEREITSLRVASAMDEPIAGTLDFKHLCAIHRFIFGEIYDGAGKVRSVNIAKGNQFCNYMYIENCAHDIFAKLKAEKYLINTEAGCIHERLAYYLGEINVIHPFREGNGRAQRMFIEYLAQVAGYHVDFSTVSDSEMIEASAMAFCCDYSKLNAMFKRIVTAMSKEEQFNNIIQITGRNSVAVKIFQSEQQKNEQSIEPTM